MGQHRRGLQGRHLTLLAALLCSLLLHLLLVGGSALPFLDLFPEAEDVLATRTPEHVQRVRLASRPPPGEAPASLRVRLMSPLPPPAPASEAPRHVPAAKRERAGDAGMTNLLAARVSAQAPPLAGPVSPAQMEAAATQPTLVDPGAGAAPEGDPGEVTVASPPDEPAPAFPVQLSARLSARLGDLSLYLQQEWWMEGYHYAISVRGRHLGVPLQASSEGRLAVEGGLQPERSSTQVGSKVRSLTERVGDMLRLGRPGAVREVGLPVVVQDMMSLPFHLAVTFDGTPRTLFVSSGHTVQQYRFVLVAEELLRLPAGRLRTLHLEGEYFDHRLREMIPVVDVWLAADYLNIPVKVSGHLSDGQPFEYRLEALVIEGRQVLDSDHPELSRAGDDAIPERLKASDPQGLKNP